MEPKKYTLLFKRQRLFLMIAPAGVVILLTILFSALGGGKGSGNAALPHSKGINVTLPGPHLKEDNGVDKTAYYKKAEIDSLNERERQKATGGWVTKNGSAVGDHSGVTAYPDSNEEKLKQKVAGIRDVLNQPPPTGYRSNPYPAFPEKRESPLSSSDIDRLERMLRVMKEGQSGQSPEIQELNKTLDKLIDVQHPGKFADTNGAKSDNPGDKPLPVNPAMAAPALVNWKEEATKNNRFYDLETNSGEELPEGTAIEALVPETQTLVNGALIRLELLTELVIKGNRIPKGTPLYGIAHLNNERLLVTIGSIRHKNQVYPVSLQVVDQDGLAGIYEPGSITRDVARESVGESINGLGAASLDPSLGAQVASAGIQVARSLAGKKIKLIRLTVKAGYRVFLQDMSQKH